MRTCGCDKMTKDCVVLFVEDEAWAEDTKEIFSHFISEVIVCSKIEDVPKKHLDLVLYEPMADKLTGTIYREVKAKHPETPIICYTTIQNIREQHDVLGCNFDAIILKPIGTMDFIKLCCEYLQKCKGNMYCDHIKLRES